MEATARADYAPEGTDARPSLFATVKRTFTEFSEDNMTDWAAALTYYGLVSIPARHIFTVTTVLIALLAAGMAAQAAQYLDAAGVINGLSRQLWDTSPWLPQDGIVGRVLHALIGYTDRPTELQLIAYLATLAAMAALTRLATPARTAHARAV